MVDSSDSSVEPDDGVAVVAAVRTSYAGEGGVGVSVVGRCWTVAAVFVVCAGC